jgi:tRNA-specific 2-thiouridylase
MKKVIVGISGGIDSAVTAIKLKKNRYEVFGYHLAISPIDDTLSEKLKTISQTIGIPIEIINVEQEFNSVVIHNFREELLAGRSPSPCAICNPWFKWKLLIQAANAKNAGFVASGHYVQKSHLRSKWFIRMGSDLLKDQSYFIWGLPQEYLERILFPLGNQTKTQTREIAKKAGLGFLIKSKESTGLCFANGLSFPDLVKKHLPEADSIPGGKIVDLKGNEIGTHKGYIYYTIGQKRDLEFYNPSGFCVTAIDAAKNQLTAGLPKDLWKKNFKISNCNFADLESTLNCKTLSVKIRGFGWNPAGYCKMTKTDDDNFYIELENPAWAPAPGQPAVFYNGGILVGGGIIT